MISSEARESTDREIEEASIVDSFADGSILPIGQLELQERRDPRDIPIPSSCSTEVDDHQTQCDSASTSLSVTKSSSSQPRNKDNKSRRPTGSNAESNNSRRATSRRKHHKMPKAKSFAEEYENERHLKMQQQQQAQTQAQTQVQVQAQAQAQAQATMISTSTDPFLPQGVTGSFPLYLPWQQWDSNTSDQADAFTTANMDGFHSAQYQQSPIVSAQQAGHLDFNLFMNSNYNMMDETLMTGSGVFHRSQLPTTQNSSIGVLEQSSNHYPVFLANRCIVRNDQNDDRNDQTPPFIPRSNGYGCNYWMWSMM